MFKYFYKRTILSDRNCTTMQIKYKTMNKVKTVNNHHKTAFEQ